MTEMVNEVTLVGYVTRDPDLKTLEGERQVGSFGVATHRVYRNGKGERVDDTEFHECVIWGKAAERAQKILSKGRLTYVRGTLKTDHIDYYGISSFVTDPKRKLEIQGDIDESTDIWKRWRTILPKSEFVWQDGNHEDRLRKHLWKNDPELAYLRNLEPEKLFGLKELGITRMPYGDAYYLNPKFIAEHGDVVRKESAYTAKAMQNDRGISGISGHTHRLGTYYKRDRSGTYVWYENGTLAQLFGVEYDPFPNWQQGFTVGWFKRSGYRFHLDQIAIIDHAFVYAGERYGIS